MQYTGEQPFNLSLDAIWRGVVDKTRQSVIAAEASAAGVNLPALLRANVAACQMCYFLDLLDLACVLLRACCCICAF